MTLKFRRPQFRRAASSADPGEPRHGSGVGRTLRSPIVHFVIIGAALFGIVASRGRPLPAPRAVEREPIVISAERVRSMQADFSQRWGAPPTAGQLTALIEHAVEDEVLYREARALALDFEDGSVRRRLIEKMRAVSDRPGRSPEELAREARALGLDDDVVIRRLLVAKMQLLLQQDSRNVALGEADLQAYLEQHRARFVQPSALTFTHVFLSAATRGAGLKKDARAVVKKLGRQPPVAAASARLSDPFPLGPQMRAYSYARIEARFGKSFADQVFSLPVGGWSAPIASPYGLHLVWVEEKIPEHMPSLAAVRRQVVQAVVSERADLRLAGALTRLRSLYDIRVEGREDLSVRRTESAARG